MGVATGCGCKEVYRCIHTTYPYSSCICSFFAAASLLFVHFFILKCSSFLFQYFLVIKFYVLNNFFSQYKHIRETTGVPRQPYESHMKATQKHTQTYASYPAMDIRCMTSRSVV